MTHSTMQNDYSQTNFGAAKRFRLIIREGNQSRDMGGDDVSIAVGIVDNIERSIKDSVPARWHPSFNRRASAGSS